MASLITDDDGVIHTFCFIQRVNKHGGIGGEGGGGNRTLKNCTLYTIGKALSMGNNLFVEWRIYVLKTAPEKKARLIQIKPNPKKVYRETVSRLRKYTLQALQRDFYKGWIKQLQNTSRYTVLVQTKCTWKSDFHPVLIQMIFFPTWFKLMNRTLLP